MTPSAAGQPQQKEYSYDVSANTDEGVGADVVEGQGRYALRRRIREPVLGSSSRPFDRPQSLSGLSYDTGDYVYGTSDAERVDTGGLESVSTSQLLVIRRQQVRAGQFAGNVASDFSGQEFDANRIFGVVATIAGVMGATASLFVGWMIPFSVIAIIFGVIGLRRDDSSMGRGLANIGIGSGTVGIVFSAVWIGYYLTTFGLIRR